MDGKVDFEIGGLTAIDAGVSYDRGYRVLLDKDGLSDRLAADTTVASPPTAEEFCRCVHWFTAAALMGAKAIARDEPWMVKTRDRDLKAELLQMIDWDHRARYGWGFDTWYHGVHLRRWMDADVQADLERCWARFSLNDSRAALLASVELFDRLCRRTAEVLGFEAFDRDRIEAEMERILIQRRPGAVNGVQPTQVRRGYDAAAERYAAGRDPHDLPHLRRFVELLPSGASVLDVGCGSGQPVDAFLVEQGIDVTGIDISPRQIELARARVMGATYEVRDMLDLAAGEYRVDGVVSLYAIFHTPRVRHAELLATLRSFLPLGGALLVTMGAGDWEGTEPDFHGAEMYWSHFDAPTNARLVEEAGFSIERDEIDETVPGERHQVILALAN